MSKRSANSTGNGSANHSPHGSAAAAADTPPRGLVCPDCACRHFFVIYTRQRPDRIVRRRECRHCGRKILTVERLIA